MFFVWVGCTATPLPAAELETTIPRKTFTFPISDFSTLAGALVEATIQPKTVKVPTVAEVVKRLQELTGLTTGSAVFEVRRVKAPREIDKENERKMDELTRRDFSSVSKEQLALEFGTTDVEQIVQRFAKQRHEWKQLVFVHWWDGGLSVDCSRRTSLTRKSLWKLTVATLMFILLRRRIQNGFFTLFGPIRPPVVSCGELMTAL